MSKADRLQRLDVKRTHLEEDYRALLTTALRKCSDGTWGLFGHRDDRWSMAAFNDELEELATLAADIDAMRETLFMDPFALHGEFFASRGPVDATAVGEPKQARIWLEKLASQNNQTDI